MCKCTVCGEFYFDFNKYSFHSFRRFVSLMDAICYLMTLSHRTNNEPHTICFVECSKEKIDFLISFCNSRLDCIRSSFAHRSNIVNQDRNIESFKTNQNETKWSGNGMFNTKMKIRTDTLRNQCDIWILSVLQTRSLPLIEISVCSDAVNVCNIEMRCSFLRPYATLQHNKEKLAFFYFIFSCFFSLFSIRIKSIISSITFNILTCTYKQ